MVDQSKTWWLQIDNFQNQISTVKLDKDNYNVWKKHIMRILKSYDLKGYVDGIVKCHEKFDANGMINLEKKL